MFDSSDVIVTTDTVQLPAWKYFVNGLIAGCGVVSFFCVRVHHIHSMHFHSYSVIGLFYGIQ